MGSADEFSAPQTIPFKASRIQHYFEEWKTISSDCKIPDFVKGCQIEFKNTTPHQMRHLKEIQFSNVEADFIDSEIKKTAGKEQLQYEEYCRYGEYRE